MISVFTHYRNSRLGLVHDKWEQNTFYRKSSRILGLRVGFSCKKQGFENNALAPAATWLRLGPARQIRAEQTEFIWTRAARAVIIRSFSVRRALQEQFRPSFSPGPTSKRSKQRIAVPVLLTLIGKSPELGRMDKDRG